MVLQGQQRNQRFGGDDYLMISMLCNMTGLAKPTDLKWLRIVVVMAVSFFGAALFARLACHPSAAKRVSNNFARADFHPVLGDRLVLAIVARAFC